MSQKKPRRLPCGRLAPEQGTKLTPAKFDDWQTKLKTYLSSAGLKYTEQRWNIARSILETGGHLDSQEIVAIVSKADPGIGAATVYRNIKVLCDAGLLERSHQDVSGRILFELPDEDHHDHIICLDCGEIFEFHNDAIEKTQISVASSLGFDLAGHRHVIHGHCKELKT